MKTDYPVKHNDSEGNGRFWAWTHRMPLAIEGIRRDSSPKWHAFKNRRECRDFVDRVNAYAKTNGEVGFGRPPKVVVEEWNYESHFEPWE